MTKLLVSVRNAVEARTALASGVDLIDVKEPRNGALGAAAADIVAEIAAIVAASAPLSVACGELLDTQDVADIFSNDLPHQINYAKLGLAGCGSLNDWPDRWRRALANWPRFVSPVAVVYADWRTCDAPPPEHILQHALRLGCRALLVDTYDKSAGNLLRHMTLAELETLAGETRDGHLLYVLAGSLDETIIHRVTPLNPDYIAVRGAVCCGGRKGSVDGERIRKIKSRLMPHNVETHLAHHLSVRDGV